MRKTIRVSALVLALAASAYAGEMQFGTPQPPPPQTAQEATTQGDMPNMSLAEVVLTLLTLI